MSAAAIQLSTIPEIHPAQENNPQERGCLSQIGHTVGKVWEVIWEKGCLTFHFITAVFFRSISWISPTLANKLETLCLYIGGAIQQIKYALVEEGLREELQELKKRNQHLDMRIQEVVDQSDILSISNGRLLWEKDQAIEERDQARGERGELILSRAPILIERDQLRRENQTLLEEKNTAQAQNEQLTQGRIEAAQAKEEMESAYHQTVEDLGVARLQLASRSDLPELNQHLSRFQELYMQSVQEEDCTGATQMALTTLIPKYQSHRGKLHEMLQKAIAESPADYLSQIPLKGILRLSLEEMDHLEQISKTFHLFEELRKPLSHFFSPPIPTFQEAKEVSYE